MLKVMNVGKMKKSATQMPPRKPGGSSGTSMQSQPHRSKTNEVKTPQIQKPSRERPTKRMLNAPVKRP